MASGNCNEAAPALPQHGVVLSPVKLWVLAMLAPKRDCAWLRSRRCAANLTGLARDCLKNARSGRGNRCLDRTKEHPTDNSKRLQTGMSTRYSYTSSADETINASHTEILTAPAEYGASSATAWSPS